MKRPGRPQWLLIKHRDEYATAALDIVEDATTSVVTGRTMEDIATGKKRTSRSRKTTAARGSK
jgi:bifunctional non-homologous end joining protein LigD